MKKARLMLLILCLLSLTACSSTRQIVKTEYVRTAIPAPPAEPEYYPVKWQSGNGTWFLDEQNTKNLLKNIEIMKAYQVEMRQMLIKLNEGSK